MTSEPLHPAVARIMRDHEAADLLDLLGNRLSGADFTALMLEVVRRRAEAATPADVCFKTAVVCNGEEVEVGDGGIVDWTQALLNNRKERLMISGLSLERLVAIRRNPDRS